MALTDAEVATKVLKRLGLPIEQRPNIFLFIPPARVAVARAVANSPDPADRKAFQQIFGSLAITSQAVDLSTLINLDPKIAEPMIITAPFPAVRVGAFNAWYKSDYQLLQFGKIQNDQIWYANEGNIVHFRNKTSVTGTAAITAQVVLSTAHWPEGRFEVELINEVAQMFAMGVR